MVQQTVNKMRMNARLIFSALFMVIATLSFAQSTTVKGVVTDKQGEPLIGVNVVEKGTTNGNITDLDGNFTLTVEKGRTLVFSYVGFISQEVKVTGNSMNITLLDDAQSLEEVVVVGYGTVKRKDFTGSLTSVDTKKLLETNNNNAAAAMQGQIAGVDIQRSNNKPGAGINIMIRGQNNISAMKGGDELTNMNDINQPLYVVDGMFVDNINDIAPDDIERIDVLKDASSTAIYGSRGANGVVIVSTKRGTAERSHVEYNGSVSFGQATNLPDMMDGDQYVQYVYDRMKGQNWTNPDYEPDMEATLGANKYKNWQNRKYMDWADDVFRTAISTTHNVRIYGNGKGLNYTFGAGYTNENGTIENDNFTRYNFSTAVDKQINPYLKAGTNIYAAYSIKSNSGVEAFRQTFRLNPLTDKYDENGDLLLYPDKDAGSVATNPWCDIENQKTEIKNLHVFGNLYLEIKPVKWLKFTTTFTPDATFNREGEYRGLNTKSSGGNTEKTRAYYKTYNQVKYTWDNLLYAEQSFGDHNLNLTLGTSWYKYQYEFGGIRADGFTTDHYQWYNIGAANLNSGETSTSFTQEQLMSYLARLNYDFKGRYLLTFTGRYDGSSKLADGHRWAFFPSAAVGWRISDEAFLRNVEAISNLKLRVSYGVSGNDHSVSAYQSKQTISNSWYLFGDTGMQTAYLSSFENKNLSWEKTKEWNIGLDYAFFNGRINGTIDFYDRRTSDIIMARKMSMINGYDFLKDNVGKVLNRGLEISLNTINVQAGDFSWSTNINFTTNHNEILELSNGALRDEANGWFVGQPIGVVWTYDADGIWQEDEAAEAAKYNMAPGNYKIKDLDGDYAFTNADKVFKGSLFPKWTGGMTNTFRYKGIDLSVFLYTRQGQWSYAQAYRNFTMGDNIAFNCYDLNYWTPENPTGTWWRPGITKTTAEGDYVNYVETSFTKIGYINLGYTFPTKMIKKAGLSKLRVYASVQNPFVWTDYLGWDPETASENTYTQYAMTRSFVVGLNVTF